VSWYARIDLDSDVDNPIIYVIMDKIIHN